MPAPAREHAEREQRRGFSGRVRQLARDAQRLAEVLVGQLPLPEPVADQAQVLVVSAHAGEHSLALVELQGLLEAARGLAPFAQVLVDDAEVVERAHHAVGVLDAPERGRGALQPVDRLVRAAAARERDAHGQ